MQNSFQKIFQITENLEKNDFKIVVDSREVKKGDLFFAMKGEREDGHEYLKNAKNRGAVAAVVSKDYLGQGFGLNLIKVQCVNAFLENLAEHRLEKNKAKIVAITGSCGKTTTKDFLKVLIENYYRTSKSFKNYNTPVGLSLSVLNAPIDTEVFILEMGVSKVGDMEGLLKIVVPDIALITKISEAHLEGFSGLDKIFQEKVKIFENKKTKVKIICDDLSKYFQNLENIQKYSINNPKSDFFAFLSNNDLYVDENQRRIVEKEIFPFSESFFLEDFLAAFSIARFLNVPREIILKNVKYLKPSPMRFEKIVKDDVLFINDTYNASPISVKMAIQNFPISQRSGRKILVLGSMKELGEKSNKIHQEILDVAVRDFDFTLLLGSEFEALVRGDVYENVFVFNEKEALISKLEKIVFKGSVVLIKGARFHKMEKIVDHFLK